MHRTSIHAGNKVRSLLNDGNLHLGETSSRKSFAKTPMQYKAIFHGYKKVNFQMKNFNIFLIFVQNIDCGYTLEPPQFEAVLMSTHNLCFRAKIRKNVYPCKPQLYYMKVGCKGVYITRTCFHDELRPNGKKRFQEHPHHMVRGEISQTICELLSN